MTASSLFINSNTLIITQNIHILRAEHLEILLNHLIIRKQQSPQPFISHQPAILELMQLYNAFDLYYEFVKSRMADVFLEGFLETA